MGLVSRREEGTKVLLQKTDDDETGSEKSPAKPVRSGKDFALGITYAALVGLFGGSILVPLAFVAAPAVRNVLFVFLGVNVRLILTVCLLHRLARPRIRSVPGYWSNDFCSCHCGTNPNLRHPH